MHKLSYIALSTCCLICFGIALSSGCVSPPTHIASAPKQKSANDIIDTLQETNPLGLSQYVAQTQMEKNGFQCSRVPHGKFVHKIRNDQGATQRRVLEDIDFIRCIRKTKNGIWVTQLDEVALVIKDDLVVEFVGQQ